MGRDTTTLPLHLAGGEEATAGVIATGVVRPSLLGFFRQLTTFCIHAGPPAQRPVALRRCKGADLSHRPLEKGAGRVIVVAAPDRGVAMRPIRTLVPLALSLVALAVAGCHVGLWPVRTLEQARMLQDGADAGHQL